MRSRLPLIISPTSSISARNDFKVFNSFTDAAGVTHVYGAHMVNGARISNHQASAHVKNGEVTSFSSSFVLEYVEQPDGKIVYAYKFQLRDNPATKWVQVWCDATTGKVIQAVDFANDASYKVVSVPRRDPTEGFSTVSNPEIKGSSPNGWTDGKATEGNNIITSNLSGKTTPSTRNGVFDTKFNGG
ncbi:hypothetical protein BASA81_011475 [Batrachochytrium salamandrivorans]|nr:hypothetical protein BASA81_011475 [Batrachochytrium salamandrivorans]